MASDDAVNQHNVEKSNEYETSTDRSLLDFMKKDDQDESKAITTEFDDKLHVSKPEPKLEDCKVEEEEDKVSKPSLLQKLHRSGSSSSSSEEEMEEGGEIKKKKKEKKGLKEKLAEKIHKDEDTSAPVQVTEPEEKKGLLEKIKDKLPGGGHKEEQESVAPATLDHYPTAEGGEPAKKGMMDKIKEKIPGLHPKTTTEEDKKQNDCA